MTVELMFDQYTGLKRVASFVGRHCKKPTILLMWLCCSVLLASCSVQEPIYIKEGVEFSPAAGTDYPYNILGLDNWKLQLPEGRTGNINEQKDLRRYINDDWFYATDSNTGVQFRTPSRGPKTSTGAGGPRTELRHNVEWSSNGNAYKTLTVRVNIRDFPSSERIGFAQIHTGSDDLLLLEANASNNKFRLKVSGDAVNRGVDNVDRNGFITGVDIQEDKTFTVEIRSGRGKLRIRIDGEEVYNEAMQANSSTAHFKTGIYLVGSKEDDTSARIQMYGLNFK